MIILDLDSTTANRYPGTLGDANYGEAELIDGDATYAAEWQARVDAAEPSALDRANAAMRSLEDALDRTADEENTSEEERQLALAAFTRGRKIANLCAQAERKGDDRAARLIADAGEALARSLDCPSQPALDVDWGRKQGGKRKSN